MKVIVNPHSLQVISTPVNELEINVTKVEFEFSEEITDSFVKEAYFTLEDNTYKQIIVNNECDIPSEVLTKVGTIELGVVAYLVENEEEIVRYNPKPGYFSSWEGSLKDADNSQPITPTEMEQYEQALNDGLDALDDALVDLQDKVDSGYFDGADGTDGITPTIGNNGNWYLGEQDTGKPSRGEQGIPGETGATGQPGRDGVDGTSPTANVSKSGNTTTISITDKNGTTTATISDGVNGTNGRDGYMQYTAGDNITIEDNVISATGSIQYSTMPTADSSTIGDIIQYTGTTNNDYINGYFYIGTSATENNETIYNWEAINVQDSANISEYVPSGNSFDLLGFKKGLYLLPWCSNKIYYSPTKSGNYTTTIDTTDGLLKIITDITDSLTVGTVIGYVTTFDGNYYYINKIRVKSGESGLELYTVLLSKSTYQIITSSTQQTITGEKTFSVIPKVSNNNIIPTDSKHFSTKKYVDDNANPIVTTSSASTYTIASLIGNQSYKLGEITALTITAVTTFDKETIIYFDSGSTATTISIPDSLTNLGDVPTLTTSDNVSTGTCEASKSYIIAVLNNIAVWKAY